MAIGVCTLRSTVLYALQDEKEEPNTRRGSPPARMKATVTAGPGLVPGKEYELCRFEGTKTLPTYATCMQLCSYAVMQLCSAQVAR